VSLEDRAETVASTSVEALLFDLAERRFALALRDVFEVVRAVAVRELPKAPTIVRGIIDLRGELLPVLDLRARCGLPSVPIGLDHNFVIALAGRRRVALHVDRALTLRELSMTSFASSENLPQDIAHLAGIAATEDGLVVICDLADFLSQSESSQLDAALDATSDAAEPAAE
jgi:purine-binding chemotaxis protein CheW